MREGSTAWKSDSECVRVCREARNGGQRHKARSPTRAETARAIRVLAGQHVRQEQQQRSKGLDDANVVARAAVGDV